MVESIVRRATVEGAEWRMEQREKTRAVLGGGGGVRNANRHERSRGRSLLHGQDMGKTQDHRKNIKQWLAAEWVGQGRVRVGQGRVRVG